VVNVGARYSSSNRGSRLNVVIYFSHGLWRAPIEASKTCDVGHVALLALLCESSTLKANLQHVRNGDFLHHHHGGGRESGDGWDVMSDVIG